ncbi:MAG: hypothetical protein AB7F98_15280 [Novosphingobium sp.]
MKLVRWPVAAVTAFVIYKYTIGKKTKGEAVFAAPDEAGESGKPPRKPRAKPKQPRKPKS